MAPAFAIPKRAMAVFAHPDDVDFGCSGTLASWIRAAGTHVTYCVITSGQKGTHDPKMTPEVMAETRQREQRARLTPYISQKLIRWREPRRRSALEDRFYAAIKSERRLPIATRSDESKRMPTPSQVEEILSLRIPIDHLLGRKWA